MPERYYKIKKWKTALICVSVPIAISIVFFVGFFILNLISFNDRIAELHEHSDFADDGAEIVFTFDLNRRDLYADLIEEFNLDEITAGHYDVDLMIVLLNWVKDNFRHHGASWFPDNHDAISIINFMQENPRGINCRGLAILLAELLRLYGVEAKHITVMSPEDDHPVHVVTHAFSRDLEQWIMLDPTFRIYLQDEYGNFMDLYTLRRAFAEGWQDTLIHNNNAQITGGWLYWQIFMADYLFRFSTATNFTFGSDYHGRWRTGERWESSVMLVPDGFQGGDADLVTTSAEAFFAPPR